jgi:ribonucleoside-diphosphate reductase alpha chain
MGKAFRETRPDEREEMERLLRAVEKEMEHKDGGWGSEEHTGRVERC